MNPRGWIFFFAAAIAGCGEEADPSPHGKLLAEASAAEARLDSGTALQRYLALEAISPDDAVIQQKIARQYSDLTIDTADPAEQRRLGEAALRHAKRAIALAPDDPVNELSLAICYGKLALHADARAKVEFSREVRLHAENALRLNPDYDYAHHILGRWHHEVASLGATKRWLVRVIYGGLPEASHVRAIEHLQRAVALAPQRLSHRVELGFALLADEQWEAARDSFRHALTLAPQEKHDAAALRRAREALATLPR